MSSVWSRFVACSLMLCFGVGALLAQTDNLNIKPKGNSPYSRFGLGNLVDQYFMASGGMAGLSAAFQDPFHLNIKNPASLSWLQATAFEVGLDSRYASMDGGEEVANNWSGNLRYMALGFPLKNPINEAIDRRRSPLGIGMAFVLQPYSSVGYDVLAELEGDGTGNTVNSFKGAGGTYRFMWGNSVRYEGFSAGVNLAYLFGKLTNSRRIEFPDQVNAYNSEFLDETSLSGWMWEFGAQYAFEFMEPNNKGEREFTGKRLVAGIFGSGTNSFNTRTTNFVSRDNRNYNVVRDTISFSENVRQNGQFPSTLSVGLTYEEINRLRVGLEYGHEFWSQYENEAKPESLSNSWNLRVGAEYIPDNGSYNNYFEKVRYRLGGFYKLDPRTFGVGQLKQFALTMGFGFPIVRPRQQTSFVNFAVEVGRFGHPDLIQESYIKMGLGFTLNDNTWFFKRKFN